MKSDVGSSIAPSRSHEPPGHASVTDRAIQEESETESQLQDSHVDDCTQNLLNERDTMRDDFDKGLVKLSSV